MDNPCFEEHFMNPNPTQTGTGPLIDEETGLPIRPNGKLDLRANRHGKEGDEVPQAVRRKVVLAALAGNFVEWYEFAAYGVVAAFVAVEFFPSEDPLAALMGVYAVFGLAFVARPIGGIIISRFGDTMGRKAVMAMCIRSEEHTSELQSRFDLVCRLLLEIKKYISSTE